MADLPANRQYGPCSKMNVKSNTWNKNHLEIHIEIQTLKGIIQKSFDYSTFKKLI